MSILIESKALCIYYINTDYLQMIAFCFHLPFEVSQLFGNVGEENWFYKILQQPYATGVLF